MVRGLHGLSQGIGQLQAVRQAGERVESRQVRNLVRRFALLGDIRPDAAETVKHAIIIQLRRSGQFPPAVLTVDLDRDQQVAEAVPAFELFRQFVQGGREFAACPGFPRDHLQKRLAFDLVGRLSQGMREPRRHMRYPPRRIGLPEPVSARILEFLEQQADHFAFLGQARFRDPPVDE